MRALIPTAAFILCCLALPAATQAPSDPAKIYKTNCVLCHSADGSGDNPTGKAFHAKDLRSDEVRNQSDAALSEVITKGKGKKCQRLVRRSSPTVYRSWWLTSEACRSRNDTLRG
jgi:hypothetical protein